MSNALAIAAVTAALRNLLNDPQSGLPADLPDATISTKPPDKAIGSTLDGGSNQVNLFLYQTAANTAWRNMDMPRQVKPGELAKPPLAINLYYLLTAYGKNDDDIASHRLLGRAMSILHDHPILSPAEIEAALPGADLHQQLESVRITPQPISLEEMTQLWGTFQSQYRISAAYQVSVVLIESRHPVKAALPVLSRGSEDQGVSVAATPSPVLLEVRPPNRKPSAQPGDLLTIYGSELSQDELTLRFSHPELDGPIELLPEPGRTSTEMQVQIPDTIIAPNMPGLWPAGFYTVTAVVQRPNLPPWTTNALPFALAPRILSISPLTALQGDVTLTLTCVPQVRPEQQAVLLFGDRAVPLQSVSVPPDLATPSSLAVLVADTLPGTYVLRLRVDGVDSVPVDFSSQPPQFADDQKVTIHA